MASKELSDLRTLITFLKELEDEISVRESELRELKEQRDAFKTDHIPGFMEDLGLEKFTMGDGESYMIATKYFGNISEQRSIAAFSWLKQHGEASLIKTSVAARFGAGMEEQLDLMVLKNFLEEKEIEMDQTESVHPQTLKSFIRRKLEAGQNFPLGLFGVHVAKEVVVENQQ